ncbi:MAG: thiamine-phosphate kinase [Candidatus Omnitrophica bacterium]|nr:thiamine-phosphate kinase [Candidatus Omnitrophota bacterium]MDD5592989.1 thiamine-phosphate kinase [Candidatus Omnitrophota bacterium]
MPKIGEIGEFGLINRIKRLIKTDNTVIKGLGDDCAVLKFDKNHYQLFTCDMIVEGVDFTSQEDPYLIGRKAIAVSISDIAACAGLPRYCLVSLGLPKKTRVEFVDKIIKGMLGLAKQYKLNLVGGDMSRMRHLTIDVSMLGLVEKKNLVLRSGAKPGDIIFVSGKLGGSILGKHLKFTPRIKEARFLVKNFNLNSMIDISDGLIQDLGHILEESKSGAVIYEDLIPLSKESRGLQDALYMGEDFELLFTLTRNEARKLILKGPANFRPIGEITDKKYGFRLIDRRGRAKMVKPGGFRHF